MDPEEVEHLTGEKSKSTSAADLNVLFSQIKARLSDRDRQILVLLEQDLGPKEIAKAFNIFDMASVQPIQHARERMAVILSGTGSESNEDDKKCHDPEHLALKFDDPSPE